jgi:hypothetical protein
LLQNKKEKTHTVHEFFLFAPRVGFTAPQCFYISLKTYVPSINFSSIPEGKTKSSDVESELFVFCSDFWTSSEP